MLVLFTQENYMVKKTPLIPAVLFAVFLVQVNLFADTRTENIELYLVIDKSKSMVEEISDVSAYINENFIQNLLIPGDRLVLIQFYGNADLIYDNIISTSGKTELMQSITAMQADGRFTDIGNALDRLNSAVSKHSGDSERKYLILLTDGKQEAPPESPYYTPDGSFNHRFLEHTKVIQQSGWKVIIIGIGSDTVAEELAKEIGTTETTLDFEGDSEVKAMSSSEILGRIIAENIEITGGVISLRLKSEGYGTERSISIEQITYQLSDGNYNLLDSPIEIKIGPESVISAGIELSADLLDRLPSGKNTGTLLFNFAGDTPFLPAVVESAVLTGNTDGVASPAAAENKNKKEKDSAKNQLNNSKIGFNWLIIVLIIIAAAAVIAFIIVRNIISHRDDDEQKKRKRNAVSGDS